GFATQSRNYIFGKFCFELLPKFLVNKRGVIEQIEWPCEQVSEPGVRVAKGRLSRLESGHSGDDRSVYLAANTAYQFAFHFICWRHEHVARRGAHHLTEVVCFDLAADGTHVCVEGTYAYHDVGAEAEALRPFCRQSAGRLIRHPRVAEESGSKAAEKGVERCEEVVRRQSAKLHRPERCVTSGANAALHVMDVGAAREDERDPIAVFYPGVTSLSYRLVVAEDAQQFGPEPFGGIDPAYIF